MNILAARRHLIGLLLLCLIFPQLHLSAAHADSPGLIVESASASNIDGSLASVVYGENSNGDGAYVAVGAKGRVVRSEDGLNWTRIVLPASLDKADWRSVAYGGGKYVAVGTDRSSGTALAKLIESPDGLSWTEHSVTGSTLQKVRYVAEDAAFYVAGATWNGNNNQDQGIILRSADGETWGQWGNIPRFVKSGSSSSSAFYLVDFVKFKGKYIASTNLFTGYAYSTTGSSWTTAFATAILSDGSLEFSIYNNQLYANYNWQEGYMSSDGVSFARTASFDGTIGVGQSGSALYRYGKAGKLDISTDNGVNWTPSAKVSNISIMSFASNGTSIVMVTAALNSLLVTSDGNKWQKIEIDLKGVASGDGKWAAVGEAVPSNGNESADGGLLTSEIGFNQLAPSLALPSQYAFSKVVYGEGRFVAGGSKLGSSIDGVNWATYDLPAGASGKVVGLEYGDGVFVAVTDGDDVLTSLDGISWSLEAELDGASAMNLGYANGMFFVFGYGGVWMTASSGANWTHISSLDDYVTNSYYSFGDIAFDGSKYVLTAVDGNTGVPKALSSADAPTGGPMTWTEHEIDPAYSELGSMVYGEGYFVVVGTGYDDDNNVHPEVYYSTDAENWTSVSEQELGIAGSMLYDVYFKDGKFYVVGSDNAKVVLAKPGGGPGSTTFTVVNTHDDGEGSLRWAIAQAGAVADGQVVFDPALAGQTITLQSNLAVREPGGNSDWKSATVGDHSTNFKLTGLTDSEGKPAITVDGNGYIGLFATGQGTFSLSDIRFTGFDLNDLAGDYNGWGSALMIGGYNYQTINISNVEFDHNKMTSKFNTSIASLGLDKPPYEIHMDRVLFANNELHAFTTDGSPNQAVVFVGLYAQNSEIANSVFYNNKTTSSTTSNAYGGVIGGFMDYRLKVVNNTFYNNTVSNAGIGEAFGPVGYVFQMGGSSVDFYNNLVIDNKVEGRTVTTFEDAFYNDGGAAPTQDSNNLYTGSPFVDAASGDFHLANTATDAIDQGDDKKVIGTVDLDGKIRIQGDYVDIGAYESEPGTVGDGPSLASVLGQTDTSPGGGTGTAADPITWSINVENSVTKLDKADIVPSDSSAKVWFYDDPDYAGTNNGGFEIASLNLPEGGSATAYIQIDTSDVNKSIYYAVTIHRAAGADPATVFDYEANVTGFGTKTVSQTKGGETLVANSVEKSLESNFELAADANNGTESLATNYGDECNCDESSITFTVQGGKLFDLLSMNIVDYEGANNDKLIFTSNKGGIFTTPVINTPGSDFIPITVDVSASADSTKFQGITSFTVTAQDGGFKGHAFDDITLANIRLPAGDTTLPVLSGIDVSGITQTDAALKGTSDENATLYYVLTTSATPPTAAQVVAGQDDLGAPAFKSDNGAATAAVSKSFNITGLTAGTHYYAYIVAKDSAGNESLVGSKDFTTTAAPLSDNAYLSNLTVNPGSLTFDSNTETYTVNVPYGTTSINVTPTVADSGATVTVDDESAVSGNAVSVTLDEDGLTVIPVDVTAANGTATKRYTITVNETAAIHAETPSIGTQPSGATVNVGATKPILTVAATKSDAGTLSYQWYSSTTNSNDGGTIIPGETGDSFEAPTTSAGTTYYYVVVTNTNNSATGNKTATAKSNAVAVTVNAPSDNADLSNLTVSPGTLTFAAGTKDYTVTVPYGTASIDVTPTVADSGATVTVHGESTTSGSARTITLESDGSTLINVMVTAADGSTKLYKITVNEAAPLNSTISPTTATFDLNTANTSAGHYEDVTTNMTLNGNELSSIKNVTNSLNPGTDYMVSGSTVTIKKSYLASQAVGTTTLTFHFSVGSTQTMTITVNDTTPIAASGLTVISGDPSGASRDGKTKIEINETLPDGHKLVYFNFGSGTVVVPKVGDTLTSYDELPSDGLISANDEDAIGVAEVDTDGKTVRFGDTTAVVTSEPKPGAPNVTTDNDSNTIVGATSAMEYALNGGPWTAYDSGNPPVFPGTATVLVRVAADSGADKPAGDTTTLNFTPNPPAAPTVSADDAANVITGINATMEYLIDGGAWVAYDSENPPFLSGEHTVKVRVKASGNVPAGEEKTITFTPNPPAAPTVSADDAANVITGINATMEYQIDGGAWVPYDSENPPFLSGEHTVKVRVKASGNVPAGEEKTITFTPNPPAAPTVSADDAANVITGINSTMEYQVDGGAWLPYDSESPPVLSGEHTVKVRVKANGNVPAGEEKTITFTPNPPAAPTVSADDAANVITGINSTMEYQIDGGAWVPYDSENPPVLNGEHTVKVRVKANGNVPAGEEKTITFTPNPPAAPTVSADDAANVITGINSTMEYQIDDGSWVPYDSENPPVLSGEHTVKVRVKATGNAPAGEEKVIIFTTNPPAAPTVSANDVTNVITGIDDKMEYAIDDGNWIAYNPASPPILSGEHTVKVRVKASGSVPAGEAKTIFFTINGTYSVLGTVVDDTPDSNFSAGATVKVMKGNVQIGSTAATDASGRFKVTGVSNGTYNLVVTKDDQIITVAVTVKDQDYDFSPRLIVLPRGSKNSAVEIKGDTPSVVVDGLNDLFADTQNVYTADDRQLVADGGSVKITLGVEKLGASIAPGAPQLQRLAGGQTLDLYLDMTLTKTRVDTSNQTTRSTLSTVGSLLKIIVPYDLTGKNNIVIYRYHDGAAQQLRLLPYAAATPSTEGYMLDAEGNQIVIWAQNFSTYAIAYGTVETPPAGGPTRAPIASFTLTATAGVGGSMSPAGNISLTQGGSQTFTIKPDEGYAILDVTVDGKSVGAVGSYTFSNVTEAHTIKADFAKIKAAGLPYYEEGGSKVFIGFATNASGTMKYIAPSGKTVQFQANPKAFTDIASHWGKSYIDFVTEREIFVGLNEHTFSPDTGMTRAMLATVIGRLYERSYGPLSATDKHVFTDVDYDSWYGAYLDWAAGNGIIQGVGGTRFEPDRQVTRQELAAMLYRFAQFIKADTSVAADKTLSYSDASAIDAWARQAALYTQQFGIITGRSDNAFAPKETATRAEVAAMLQRFIETVV
ncbi:DUF4073 domain-containing protein [Cohnella sp. GbtcB17]|uniref:DUF4073 domain-containing protein n=1 Tax=Cohnella sp. GbtcB17 TaxID=2824762 RepID=UPI001C2F326D|nr:DUF4073 domain-containing protein [Cohnella sp. GbtcB17]